MTSDIYDEITLAIASTLPDWSRETVGYKRDIVQTIVERLRVAGISDITIRNSLITPRKTLKDIKDEMRDLRGVPPSEER